jgi:hypothetical protein
MPNKLDGVAMDELDEKIEAARGITAAAFVAEQFTAALKGLQLQIDLEARRATRDSQDEDATIRANHIAEINSVIENARQRGSLTALSNLLRHRSVLLGLDKPAPPVVEESQLDPPADAGDHLAELVRAARRGRLTAEAQGSHIAASSYLKQERELLRITSGSEAQIERATDNDLMQIIKEAAASLPDDIRAELGDLETTDGGAVH